MNQSPLSQASDDRLAEMLFAGEDIEEEVALDGARIAVTSHRILAFMPEGGDRRFDHADRPNVLDASVQTAGRNSYLSWMLKSVLYGVITLGGGYVIHSSGILSQLDGTKAPKNRAVSGVNAMVELMSNLFVFLADALVFVGAFLLLVGAALGWVYYTSRSEELVIERAGRDPIRVPVGGERAESVARTIRASVGTGSKSQTD